MIGLIEMRRDLHRHPELGFTEFRTASKVVGLLRQFGYKVIYGQYAMEPCSVRGLPSKEVLEAAYKRALRDGADPTIAAHMKGELYGCCWYSAGRAGRAYRGVPVRYGRTPDYGKHRNTACATG